MTKKESLEICRDMWTWLSEDPKVRSKYDYLREHGQDNFNSDCPCCEFTASFPLPPNCTICPLKDYWPEKYDSYSTNYPCLLPESPYYNWESCSDYRIRHGQYKINRIKENCLTIVNFCKEELKKMEKENVEESR